jgi:hypothetical protein
MELPNRLPESNQNVNIQPIATVPMVAEGTGMPCPAAVTPGKSVGQVPPEVECGINPSGVYPIYKQFFYF